MPNLRNHTIVLPFFSSELFFVRWRLSRLKITRSIFYITNLSLFRDEISLGLRVYLLMQRSYGGSGQLLCYKLREIATKIVGVCSWIQQASRHCSNDNTEHTQRGIIEEERSHPPRSSFVTPARRDFVGARPFRGAWPSRRITPCINSGNWDLLIQRPVGGPSSFPLPMATIIIPTATRLHPCPAQSPSSLLLRTTSSTTGADFRVIILLYYVPACLACHHRWNSSKWPYHRRYGDKS